MTRFRTHRPSCTNVGAEPCLQQKAAPGLRVIVDAKGIWIEFTAGGESIRVDTRKMLEHCGAKVRPVLRAWCAERRSAS